MGSGSNGADIVSVTHCGIRQNLSQIQLLCLCGPGDSRGFRENAWLDLVNALKALLYLSVVLSVFRFLSLIHTNQMGFVAEERGSRECFILRVIVCVAAEQILVQGSNSRTWPRTFNRSHGMRTYGRKFGSLSTAAISGEGCAILEDVRGLKNSGWRAACSRSRFRLSGPRG